MRPCINSPQYAGSRWSVRGKGEGEGESEGENDAVELCNWCESRRTNPARLAGRDWPCVEEDLILVAYLIVVLGLFLSFYLILVSHFILVSLFIFFSGLVLPIFLSILIFVFHLITFCYLIFASYLFFVPDTRFRLGLNASPDMKMKTTTVRIKIE